MCTVLNLWEQKREKIKKKKTFGLLIYDSASFVKSGYEFVHIIVYNRKQKKAPKQKKKKEKKPRAKKNLKKQGVG